MCSHFRDALMLITPPVEVHNRPRTSQSGRSYFHLDNPTMNVPKNLGMLLLAIWLILFGVLTAPFLGVSFSHSADITAVLAIVAGVLLLMQK